MKAILLGAICAALLAFAAAQVMAPNAISAADAFHTEGVRLSEH